MFSLQYMHRQFTSRRFDQLLKSVMHNGMQLPAELQNHLLNHPVCSVALSLRRTLELSYGPPDSQTRQMVEFLLQTQEDNGSFGFAPLPTACGLAALTQILQNAPQGSPPAQRPQALHQAQTRARTALDEMIQDQATHGLPQTSLQDTPLLTESDAMDWAFILQLLSDDITWEENPAIEKLHHWFHANTNQLPTQILKLWHRACWTPTPPGSFNTETTPGSFDTGIPTTGSFSTETTPGSFDTGIPTTGSFSTETTTPSSFEAGASKFVHGGVRTSDKITDTASVHGRIPRKIFKGLQSPSCW